MATSGRVLNAIAKRQLKLREELWPDTETKLWNRKVHKGFTTIPKTMPLIMQIMDGMTKGQPVSSTYLSLWCSTWDNSFVTLSKQRDLAYAAGFGGQRGLRTWTSRMKRLNELGFILIKSGKGIALGYALILNPHSIIRSHHEQRTPGLVEDAYIALVELALEIGARDMAGETAEAKRPSKRVVRKLSKKKP